MICKKEMMIIGMLLVILVSVGGVLGDTNTWTASSLSTFDTAGSWSKGTVPVAGEDVVFNNSGNGICNVTNNTMPQDLGSFNVESGYSGTIYFNPLFAVGDWTGNNDGTQLWNVTNDINVSGGTMKIYGDYLGSSGGTTANITDEGHGQEWRSVSGDIVVGSGALINGSGLGFPKQVGPGSSVTNYGAIHLGAPIAITQVAYGNASAPTSLGSGGASDGYRGASAIKLQANGLIDIDGVLDFIGLYGSHGSSSGGSIWLKADNISGIGNLTVEGGTGYGADVGGGGIIRLEYSSELEFDGFIYTRGGKEINGGQRRSSGILTFTNNTWPGDWNINGSVGLLGGDYGEGNVVNILGDLNISSGNSLYIYGDCYAPSGTPGPGCYNTTAEGMGVWINASGNITVESGAEINGVGLGFARMVGPGASENNYLAANHLSALNGGTKVPYGNASAPTSLGSGGYNNGNGGSAIKLQSKDLININGKLDFWGEAGDKGSASGGSIWLKADNISGNGNLSVRGGDGFYDSVKGASGGIIRLEYSSDLGFDGYIFTYGGLYVNEGTRVTSGVLTFTNNTWPGDLNIKGGFGLLGGDYGEGNVVNILGDLNISSGNTLYVYGDCFSRSGTPGPGCYNTTADGSGVWLNVSGNITIESGGEINGNGLGFGYKAGPGYDGSRYHGGTYGGKGYVSNSAIYGSETEPISIGSGSYSVQGQGGSAVKLQSHSGLININGDININGGDNGLDGSGSGGSILIIANNISGTGNLNATGGYAGWQGAGGGGRISLHGNTIDFSGSIHNKGNSNTWNTDMSSGGTIYINASTSITSSGSINTHGDTGGDITFNDTLLTLTGNYNATGTNSDASINIDYTTCVGTDYSSATFDPSETDYSGCDTTPPEITINYPQNTSLNTNSIDLNYTATDGTAMDKCWYSNNSGVVNSSAQTCSLNWTGFVLSDGGHNFIVYGNDTNGNENSTNVSFFIDTVYPTISISSPENNSITSNTGKDINYTSSDNILLDSCWWTNNSGLSNTSLVSCGTNITGQTWDEGLNNITIYVNDSANNINSSFVQFTLDTTPPVISAIVYSPNLTDYVDPGTTLIFNATIIDEKVSIDTAILQYYNGTDWANTTMSNLTTNDYNATITLIPTNANYTFNIWTNDTFGNSNNSVNQTFSSIWDCNWTATSTLGAISGWEGNKLLENIVINNTGDVEFADNNCSLDFRLTYNLDEGRIYFDNVYYKPSSTYTISANSIKNVSVNVSFLTVVQQDEAIITTEEVSARSSTSQANTTATIVSNQVGPYIYQSITSNPSSVYLTSNNFSLQAYVRNLMGSSTVNASNTAYNVTFNWTLPDQLTNLTGNTSTAYTNITDNVLNYNNLQVGFASLASATSGVKTIYLYSQGYNQTGSLIEDANDLTTLTEAINISFLCYGVSDGTCVTDCGYEQDPDCEQATTEVPTTTTGGGGGGGGSSKSLDEFISSSEDLQLVRGKENEIIIPIKNRNKNYSLTDLKFSVTGDIAKYILVMPYSVYKLDPNEEINITLTITSPTYIELGKQKMVLVVNGMKGVNKYQETKTISLEIHELSGKEAQNLLEESNRLTKQLSEMNLSKDYLTELLEQSKLGMEIFDYELVLKNHDIIKGEVTNALEANKIINELDSLATIAEQKGIDISNSQRLVKLTKLSLERREFEQAYQRAKDAQFAYALEIKGELGKLSYYMRNYPQEISFSAVILALISFGTYRVTRLQLIKKKIKKLKEEEAIINQLIAIVQKECFKEKKMSMEEYRNAMEEYQKRLAGVIEGLIELENKRVHALKFTKEDKRLKIERQRVIEMIKQLQMDYLRKGVIETHTYELKLQSFNKRLTEIDERMATLEAKHAFKKGFGIFKLFRVPKEGKLS